ncbi:MAG: ATP-binding protein [Xanthobacteraceae bacterium]
MSLSSRIIVRLTITTAVATAVGYGWLYMKQSRVEAYLRQRTLVRQAQEVSSFISMSPDGSVDLDLPSKLSEAYNSPASRYRYAVRDEAGRVVATSGRRVGPLPDFIEAQDRHIYEYKADGEKARMLGAAVRTSVGQRVFFTQIEQTVPMTQSLNAAVVNELFMDGGWLGIPFILALLAISAFTVRRSLSPLKELATLTAKIDPGSSTLRLPSAGIPEEILPLVSSFNTALDRLDDGLRRQREFNANAAHQLRTPLAVLAANIDTMTDSVVAAKLRYDIELMSRIVNQLLLVARLETLNIRLDEPVDLCSTARQAAENLGPIAISACKTLEVDEPSGAVLLRGNAFVVTVAISNLIENALNHSPPGKAVRIRVTSSPSVEVRDSGPGIPAELREKIFERFWRGESSKEGAGLGLSIVRRIMDALNGTVSVEDAPDGGAQFTLHFPAWDGAA